MPKYPDIIEEPIELNKRLYDTDPDEHPDIAAIQTEQIKVEAIIGIYDRLDRLTALLEEALRNRGEVQ